MKNIFKKLFCLHKWEEMMRAHHDYKYERFYRITFVCKNCGKIIQIKP